jgi:hypothetical protein
LIDLYYYKHLTSIYKGLDVSCGGNMVRSVHEMFIMEVKYRVLRGGKFDRRVFRRLLSSSVDKLLRV